MGSTATLTLTGNKSSPSAAASVQAEAPLGGCGAGVGGMGRYGAPHRVAMALGGTEEMCQSAGRG